MACPGPGPRGQRKPRLTPMRGAPRRQQHRLVTPLFSVHGASRELGTRQGRTGLCEKTGRCREGQLAPHTLRSRNSEDYRRQGGHGPQVWPPREADVPDWARHVDRRCRAVQEPQAPCTWPTSLDVGKHFDCHQQRTDRGLSQGGPRTTAGRGDERLHLSGPVSAVYHLVHRGQ